MTVLGLLLAALLYCSLSVAVSAFGQRPFRIPRNWRALVSPDAYWRWTDDHRST